MSTSAYVHVSVGLNPKDWCSFRVVISKVTRYDEKTGKPYEIDVQMTVFTVGEREFSFEGNRVGYGAVLEEMGLEDDYVEDMEFGHLGDGRLGVRLATVETYEPQAELDLGLIEETIPLVKGRLKELGIDAEPKVLMYLEWG